VVAKDVLGVMKYGEKGRGAEWMSLVYRRARNLNRGRDDVRGDVQATVGWGVDGSCTATLFLRHDRDREVVDLPKLGRSNHSRHADCI
jgi:hypothetical protein